VSGCCGLAANAIDPPAIDPRTVATIIKCRIEELPVQ
jgi:hypothetical protein